MKKRVLIIGGGLSGLSSAIYLAADGHQVAILEQNETVGGQLGRIQEHGFSVDIGTAQFTMPHILSDLFATTGKKLDMVTLEKTVPQWRAFYPDGKCINLTSDDSEWLSLFSTAGDFTKYLEFCRQMDHFVTERINPTHKTPWFKRFQLAIKRLPKNTIAEIHREYLHDSHLEQLFNYFALIESGRSANWASVPMVLQSIYHQLHDGLYTFQGGAYQLIEALVELLYESGVEIRTNETVSKILTECSEVVGVELTDGTQLPADIILSSVDPYTTQTHLLRDFKHREAKKQIGSLEPSLSAHVLIVQTNCIYEQLASHNLFFSTDPDREMHELFTKKIPAQDPTLRVSLSQQHNQQKSHQTMTITSYVPALNGEETWETYRKPFFSAYRRRVITKLEQMGLAHLERNIHRELEITPDELQKQLGSMGGGLFGAHPPNTPGKTANIRAKLDYQTDGIQYLYLIGNSVSYGQSVHNLLLSSKYITTQIRRDLANSSS